MGKLKAKPRQQDTYRQTFNFSDPPPIPKQNPLCNNYKFLSCKNEDITAHNVENVQTIEQTAHRSTLYTKNEQNRLLQHSSNRNAQQERKVLNLVSHAVSRQRKLNDLKGSLQTTGVQQFLKSQYEQGNNIYKEKLIGYDCSFLHQCHDRTSKQNQFVKYNKGNISRQLKNAYDLGHQGSIGLQYRDLINEQNRVFVFQEKKDNRLIKKQKKK